MENIIQQVINIALGIAVWILLAIARKPLQGLLKQADDLITDPIDKVTEVLHGASDGVIAAKATSQAVNERISSNSRELLQKIVSGLGSAITAFDLHWNRVISQIEPDEKLRGWRVIGVIILLPALVLFIYADLVLGFNSLTVRFLFPELQVPELLSQNYFGVALLASSAGSAAVLGLILLDFLGQTHFTTWNNLEGRKRTLLIGLVVITLIMTLVLSLFLALARYEELRGPESQPTILQDRAQFAQSAILLPMLITTALLSRSLIGLLLFWIALVGITLLVLRLARFFTDLLMTGVPSSGKFIFGTISMILLLAARFVLFALALPLDLLSMIMDALFGLIQKALEAFTEPPIRIGHFVANQFLRGNRRR